MAARARRYFGLQRVREIGLGRMARSRTMRQLRSPRHPEPAAEAPGVYRLQREVPV
jgi:hypothetical protein